MNSLRIGLTQRVEVVESYAEHRDCLDQAWARLLCDLGFTPVPLSNCVADVGQYVTSLGLHGVILTGGNDLECTAGGIQVAPERDRFEHSLIEFSVAEALPLFGVCRGMQMLVVHHGGSLSRVEGHVARPHTILAIEESVPEYFCDIQRTEVNSYHGYGVTADGLGKDIRGIAVASDGTIEAVSHRTLCQSAVMWHPERAPHDARDANMIRHFFQETQL